MTWRADSYVRMSTHHLDRVCGQWTCNCYFNLNKTKIIVFNNTPEEGRDNFEWKMNGDIIERKNTYPYLGMEMSSKNKFNTARECIKNKAMKAVFCIWKCSQGSEMPTKIGLNMFDKLIKPILLYGCELLVLPDNMKCLGKKSIEELYEYGSKGQNPGEKLVYNTLHNYYEYTKECQY